MKQQTWSFAYNSGTSEDPVHGAQPVRRLWRSQQPPGKGQGSQGDRTKEKGAQVTRESGGNQASSPGALAPAPRGSSRADRLYSEPWVPARREKRLHVPSHGLPHTLRFLGADSILRLRVFLGRFESQDNIINYTPYSKCHVSNGHNFHDYNRSEWEARNKDVLENLQRRKCHLYSLRFPPRRHFRQQ